MVGRCSVEQLVLRKYRQLLDKLNGNRPSVLAAEETFIEEMYDDASFGVACIPSLW